MKKYQSLTDEKIVDLILKDKEIYAVIIDRYQEKLKKYVYYLTGDKEKVNDIVQNTFIKAYINLNSFNKKLKFSSWLYRIAHNETINFIRKESFFKKIDFNFFVNLTDEKEIDIEIDKKLLEKKLNQCLDKLSYEYREVLILHFLEEKNYDEISDILRISKNLVGVRINRAKKKLKIICQEI